MQRVATAERINVYEEVHPGLSASLEELFEMFPPYVCCPVVYGDSDGKGGPPVDDPLMLDFALPAFSEHDDTGPIWRISLDELLEAEFDFIATGALVDGDEKPIAVAMVRRLREIADRLDARIA